MGVAVVVLAAGSGTRVGAGVNKVLLPIADEPIVARSVRVAADAVAEAGGGVVVVIAHESEIEELAALLAPNLPDHEGVEIRLGIGGATRHASESAALRVLEDAHVEVVAIHDGARPLSSPGLYAATLQTARDLGGAVPAVPLSGLVSRAGGPVPGLSGAEAYAVGVQTPQAFRTDALRAAFAWAQGEGFEGTDTAGTVAAWADATEADVRIGVVAGDPRNLKVTYPDDLRAAAMLGTVQGPITPA